MLNPIIKRIISLPATARRGVPVLIYSLAMYVGAIVSAQFAEFLNRRFLTANTELAKPISLKRPLQFIMSHGAKIVA